jgi:hypothetical protein
MRNAICFFKPESLVALDIRRDGPHWGSDADDFLEWVGWERLRWRPIGVNVSVHLVRSRRQRFRKIPHDVRLSGSNVEGYA